jgi:hypothetical protein
VSSRRYPAHAALELRCIEVLDELEAIALIRDEVARFKGAHFRPTMIGVHLRRGDFIRVRPDVSANTNVALHRVRQFLARAPDAGILLCTDDGAHDRWGPTATEGVLEIFHRSFGDRVVSRPPRSLDRSTPEAVQDGLIDLLLLRQTDMFVGTANSSFSTLAIYGREVPGLRVGAPRPMYRWMERAAKATGVYYLLKLVGRFLYGRSVPVLMVWRRLVVGSVLGLKARWLRRRPL